MIRGLIAAAHAPGGTKLCWSSSAAAGDVISILRHRTEVVTAPEPWSITTPITLRLVIGGTRQERVELSPTENTAAHLQAKLLAVGIVSQVQAGRVRILCPRPGVSLQVLPGAGPLGIFPPVATPDTFAVVCSAQVNEDFTAEGPYRTFVDPLGLPTDEYGVVAGSGPEVRVCPRQFLTPVTVVEGWLCAHDGTARSGLTVALHEVPPQDYSPASTEPETVNREIAWQALPRPVDAIYASSLRPKRLLSTLVTDERGAFACPVARGSRVWLEIPDLGYGFAFDVPLDATYVDVNALQEFRRTAMMGPDDRN